jgi:isopenicillin-N epimerase
MIGSLAAVLFPERTPKAPSAAELYEALVTRHQIEAFIVPWPELPSGFVRVSAQLYNRLEQYQRLANALQIELGLS